MNIEDLNAKIDELKVGERMALFGVPEELYHQSNGIGSTLLKAAHKSLAHYKAVLDEDDDRSPAALKAMGIGSATHCLVLEAEKYGEKFVKQSDDIKVRNGKKWEQFLSEHSEQVILTSADEELASAMSDAVLDNAGKWFLDGEAEKSYWYRHESGLILKARIDYEIGDAGIDLKTTKHENPGQFTRAVKYDYDMQDALYRLVSGLADFIFVGVGKAKPHSVFLCKNGSQVRELAEKNMLAAINRISEGIEFNQYPHMPVELIETALTTYELERLA